MNGHAAFEALAMLEEGLEVEINKVRFITAMADYCPDPNEVFNFSSDEANKSAWYGFMLILEDTIKAFDNLCAQLEKIRDDGKEAEVPA